METKCDEIKSLETSIIIDRKGGVIFESELEHLGVNMSSLRLLQNKGLIQTTEMDDNIAYAFTDKGKDIYDSTKRFYLEKI